MSTLSTFYHIVIIVVFGTQHNFVQIKKNAIIIMSHTCFFLWISLTICYYSEHQYINCVYVVCVITHAHTHRGYCLKSSMILSNRWVDSSQPCASPINCVKYDHHNTENLPEQMFLWVACPCITSMTVL